MTKKRSLNELTDFVERYEFCVRLTTFSPYTNGRVTIRGLDFDDEGFSLTNEEGGGGYIPATEDDVQLTEDHG